MNAASQLLRVLAILGAIASGVFFYMTNGKIADLNSQLATAKSSAQAQSASAASNIKDLQEALTKTNDDITALKNKANAATSDTTMAQKNLQAALDQLNADQDATKALNRKIADSEAKVAPLQTAADSVAGLNQQISDLQQKNSDLQAQIADLIKQGPKPPTPANAGNGLAGNGGADSMPVAPANLGPRAPAKILSVDTKSWLIVLDVGSNSGVQNDSELYLKVGDQNLAVVKVRNTSPTMTTAAIVSTQDIQPGNFSKIATKGLKIDFQRVMQ